MMMMNLVLSAELVIVGCVRNNDICKLYSCSCPEICMLHALQNVKWDLTMNW